MTPRHLLQGALAGAAGTAALNAATYVDMAVRARPASSTPEQTVEHTADLLDLPLPEDDGERNARTSGLGALLGIVTGISVGAALGAIRATTGHPKGRLGTVGTALALAMLAGNAPMTTLGITDPRSWRAADWIADVLPHLAYAGVAATALDELQRVR